MKAFISIYFNISFIIYFLNLVNGNDNNICTICLCRITKQMSLIDCSSRKLVKSSLNWDNLVLPKKRFVNQEYVDFDMEDNEINEINNIIPKLSIVRLSYKKNNISIILDEAFHQLEKLSYLDLSHNKLANLSKEIFKGPRQDTKGFPSPIRGKHISLFFEIFFKNLTEICQE